MAGIPAQALAVVAELGVADVLAGGPKSAAELAHAVNAQPAMLHRLLRYTASLGVFRDVGDGRFELTPLGEILHSDSPHSLRAAGRMIQRASRAFNFMLENVRTGKCAYDLAFGKPIFEDLSANPHEAAIFDAAMSSFHGGETGAFLAEYLLAGVNTICDIGCGNGSMMAATLTQYPQMTGILFDLGHVMERTRANMTAANLTDRCRFETGSFFDAVPDGADVYTIRHILHDWPDDASIGILRNVRKAIKATGKLLILEAVIPEGNDPSISKLFDMAMMVWPHGQERTAEEYRMLLAAADFTLAGITPTQSAVSVVEARPRG